MKQFIDVNSVESLNHSFRFVKAHDLRETDKTFFAESPVEIQPLQGPKCLIFYLRWRYSEEKLKKEAVSRPIISE